MHISFFFTRCVSIGRCVRTGTSTLYKEKGDERDGGNRGEDNDKDGKDNKTKEKETVEKITRKGEES